MLERLGIDPDRPSVVYVGRITRQKGLPYLLRAAARFPAEVQLVLLAGAPDTPEIAAEVRAARGRRCGPARDGVVWVQEMLPKPEVIQVLTHATVFVCPSIYEPMGIVNLEAMACETAVVATATGGIPEVVADGETGLLVPIAQASDGSGTPVDPDRFVADLAAAINERAGRSGPGRRDGPGRPAAGGRALLLGGHRRTYDRGLPVRLGLTPAIATARPDAADADQGTMASMSGRYPHRGDHADAGRRGVPRQGGGRRAGADRRGLLPRGPRRRWACNVVWHGPDGEPRPFTRMDSRASNDRWHATIRPDAVGDWTFTVEAFADPYLTWRRAVTEKIEAGQGAGSWPTTSPSARPCWTRADGAGRTAAAEVKAAAARCATRR